MPEYMRLHKVPLNGLRQQGYFMGLHRGYIWFWVTMHIMENDNGASLKQ